MRWLSFIQNKRSSFGYVTSDGTGVVDVGARTEVTGLKEAIAGDLLAQLADSCGDVADLPLDGIEYAPVIPKPDKILCVGLNYKDHQDETGRGGEPYPTIFLRLANAQVGHQQPMIRPRESGSLDYEGEIAIVIGRSGRRIPRDQALSHIAGFSIYNDGSIRQYQGHTSQFTPGKNFTATGAFGPWMMTPDEVGDLQAMKLTTRLNGEVMQQATSDLMVFDFAAIIEYCSTFTELVAGDVLVTGTPGGVGVARKPPVFMKAGDGVEVEVQPIGTLTNSIKAD